MFYKIGFFLLFGIVLFVAGSQASKFFPSTTPPTPSPLPVVTEEATPSPTVAVAATLAPVADDIDGIRTAMAKKYGKTPSDVELEVSKKDTLHAWGVTKFKGEMAGGWFLAYKETSGWIIVDDGNGTISCEKIAPYNFSVSMVEECVNASGKLIKR